MGAGEMHAAKRARLDYEGSANDGDAGAGRSMTNKPQLTRACAECKRHKIKCFVGPGESACNKCLKSGIDCVPHNFAQKFVDDDLAWKGQATATMDQLIAAVGHLLQHNHLPTLATYGNVASTISASPATAPTATPSVDQPRLKSNGGGRANFIVEGPSADPQQDDSDLVPLPMNNLYNLTDASNSRLIQVDPAEVNGPDFISRGVVSLAEAELLFNHYRTRINPLLWDGILCSHTTLDEARQSSSLMVATVLTVAALHIPNREAVLRATYDAFVSLMRASCLLRSQNLDDIRGLCIGSFYLTSLSWALCSRAVRVATEMNLHKSSLQFTWGSLESFERVRLWYALYVCDHQFALAYGRPPMMHDDVAIRNADRLLTSGLASVGDCGLVAQVKLFRILAGIYFSYGCDPDLELSDHDFEQLQSFNISLDQWRLEHQSKGTLQSRLHPRDSLMPSSSATLYYHLARFQLNSLSLRGISANRTTETQTQTQTADRAYHMHWERQQAANNAIAAAMNTVRLIVLDTDLQDAQIGMPIFVHAMIAVCASFLLKIAVVFGDPDPSSEGLLRLPRSLAEHGLNLHTQNALADVEALVCVLDSTAERGSNQHVARQVVTGLKGLLQRFSRDAHGSVLVRSSARTGGGVASSNVAAAAAPPNQQQQQPALVYGSVNSGLTALGSAHVVHDDAFTTGRTSDGQATAQQPLPHTRTDTQQHDPFDLMGDLDWRLNDAFLWGTTFSDDVCF